MEQADQTALGNRESLGVGGLRLQCPGGGDIDNCPFYRKQIRGGMLGHKKGTGEVHPNDLHPGSQR